MLKTLKNFGGKKLGGLILIAVIVIAFGFGGFGGGFISNDQNNIAKIDNKNITTKDFMNFLNDSGVAQKTIKENIDNNIIEELLSNLISTPLISLEIENFDISISDLTIFKKIKSNKNFLNENNIFQRTKYEKFLITNNMSAPMFELQVKNRELQKQLFDLIGSGTIMPEIFIEKKFEEIIKSLNVEYFAMKNLYKKKEDYTDQEIKLFLEDNKEQLKKEYIDFKYIEINPKNLIGIEEFNQDFFDKIDSIENKISQNESFNTIIENLDIKVIEIKEYTLTSIQKINEDKIYFNRSTDIDLIENGDNFLLYSITNKYDRVPNLTNQTTRSEIRDLAYQKGRFDQNRKILEEIQKKEFDNDKFIKISSNNLEKITVKSINDDKKFEINSVKMLYSLPMNSFSLVSDKENNIYLVKLINSRKNSFNKTDKNYINFINNQNINNKKTILQSYDQLLNNKYKVELNQKAIDRVKNYFK